MVEKLDKIVEENSSKEGKTSKKASVVGRAIAGGVIAGETGAIIGALSAIDKNNSEKK